MHKKTAAVILVFLLVPGFCLFAQDKSKKTYELIYEDVQFLKEQIQSLIQMLDRTAADISEVQGRLNNLAELLRQQAARQDSLERDLKAVPSQYRDLAGKIDQINSQLLKITADLAARQSATGSEATPTAGELPVLKGKPAEDKKPPAKVETQTPPKPGISPQEAYSLAYNDYLKGNFELAASSFRLYRQQFPDSPLADDALYWIGESYYSQKKPVEAIEAFDELLLAYPRTEKAAAALLKKGLCLIDLGKKNDAVTVLKLLEAKYPLEPEARIAAEKIRELTTK